MNYIDLINSFWTLRQETHFSHAQADLYFFLVHTCNRLRWKNPFGQTNKLICANIGIEEKTLIASRNRLKQVELIEFEPGHKGQPTLYYILENNQSILQGIREQSTSVSDSVFGSNPPAIFKHKQEEDIRDPNSAGVRVPARASPFREPTLEEVLDYAQMSGVQVERARDFFHRYSGTGWVNGTGQLIVNWQQYLQTWKPDKNGATHGAHQQRTNTDRGFNLNRIADEDAEYRRLATERDKSRSGPAGN